MSYTHLRDRKHYEDLYDRLTIQSGRRNFPYYEEFYEKLEKKLEPDDTIDRPGNAVLLNAFYMQVIGLELLDRYERRTDQIDGWMARDEAEDGRIAAARLIEEPYCQHCGKQGLRITDKSLMHRNENSKYDDPEDVLFMLRCPNCDKNSAFWGDGNEWKPKPTLCPKCKNEIVNKTTTTKRAIIFNYTCLSCGHSYKDKMDLDDKKEKRDPNFDKDRVYFCLLDKEFRDRLYAIKHGFEDMARYGKEMKEKDDNKHIYEAVNELKKPKIAELSTILAPALEEVGYIEFSLDKPEVGREVVVGFSCLDNISDRGNYDSEKTLKKTVDKALIETNWRLMSDGIHYRLGYLSGRLKAYEGEVDLKKLVMKSKNLKEKQNASNDTDKLNETSMEDDKGGRIEF
jgi:hypothetical protein